MAQKKVVEIEIKTNATKVASDIKQVTQETTKLGEATAEAGTKTNVFGDIKSAVTGLVPGLKGAEGGVTSLSSQLKLLLANPVVLIVSAIVVALKFIYEAFQSNVKIGKEIAAVWEGLSAVGAQVTDAVMGLVRSFAYAVEAAYKFIHLDFAGASEAMKKANGEASVSFDQLKKAVDGTTFSIVRNLEKQQQANNKAKKEQVVRQSEIDKLLVQSREILTDETASLKEKKKALESVTKAETESSKEKLRTVKIDLDILQKKAKALGGQAEIKMKQEIRDATVALNEAETENAMTGIKLNKQRKMLLRQEKEDGKAAADEAKANAKAKIDAEKERLKAKQEVINKIQKTEQDYADSLLPEQEREKVIIARKYEELYKEAEKFKLNTTKLKESEKAELEKLEKKYEDARLKIINDANKKANDAKIQAENEFQAQIEEIDEANFQTGLQKTMSEDEYALELVRQKYFKLKEQAKGNAEQLAIIETAKALEIGAIEKKAADKSITDALAVQQQKAAIQQQGLDVALQGVQLIKDVFEKSKGVQKAAVIAESAIGIAKMIISNKLANAGALATPQAIATSGAAAAPVIALNNISTGIGIAANIAATAKALKTLGGGSAPNAPASGGGGGGGGAVAPNFNVIGSSGVNQLAQIQQQPTRAYVVSGDVASGLSLERNRLQNASF
jgi:hypothetical protein